MRTYLNAKCQIENTVGCVCVAIRLFDFLDEHAERVVQLVSPQLEYVRLEGFHVTALGASFFQLGIFANHPVLPRVYSVRELKCIINLC